MDTGYRIIKESPNDRLLSIYEAEHICPICGAKGDLNGVRNNGNIDQNEYSCPECGTEWVGNYYDEHGRIKNESPHINRYRPEPKDANAGEMIINFILTLNYVAIALIIGLSIGSIACIVLDLVPMAAFFVIMRIRDGLNERPGSDILAWPMRLTRLMSVFSGAQLFMILIWVFAKSMYLSW